VWPVESLRALAQNAAGAGGVAVPLIDARKGEVYGAAYSPNGDALMAPRVGPHDALLAAARAAVGDHAMRVFGSGAVLYECASAGVPGHWHVPAARHTATLAAAAWDAAGRPAQGPALDPAYVRASDAEIAHQQRAPAGTELPR
jgi:tRNA A37 threonylcarbamoyladenosine modification protein TsaB